MTFEVWFLRRLEEQPTPDTRAIVAAQREMAEEAWFAAIERGAACAVCCVELGLTILCDTCAAKRS